MYANGNIVNRSGFPVRLRVYFYSLHALLFVVMSLLGLIVIEMRYKCIWYYRLCTTKNTESLLRFFRNPIYFCVYFTYVIFLQKQMRAIDLPCDRRSALGGDDGAVCWYVCRRVAWCHAANQQRKEDFVECLLWLMTVACPTPSGRVAACVCNRALGNLFVCDIVESRNIPYQ